MKIRVYNAQATLLAHLADQGPYEDAAGMAGGRLGRDLGYTSSAASNRLLRLAEEDGYVERRTLGRRTFRIALTDAGRAYVERLRRIHVVPPLAPTPPPAPAPAPVATETPTETTVSTEDRIRDFAKLLRSISEELLSPKHDPTEMQLRLTRRLGEQTAENERLRRELADLQGRYARLAADVASIKFERSGLRQRVRAAEENVDKLQAQLPKTPDRSGRATDRLMRERPRTNAAG